MLVALKEKREWSVLFTRRGEQLADHRGQIAFPGGQVDAGDSGPLQTALREASEEVGIPPEAVDPIGILAPVDTQTGFRIWPVICILRQPISLKPASPEVCEVFWIPLKWLKEPGRWEWQPVPSEAGRSERKAIFFEAYQGHVIWGATAMITCQVLELILMGREG